MSLRDYIAKPFGILLLWLYDLVGNYGVAIFLFALVVRVILLPFQMKSKKSMMRMSALQPQLAALQKRHEGNPRKLQEETSKLYKEEHINPMSGCLWSLIPFPILLALYRAIRFPLTTMMGVPAELLEEGGALLTKLTEMGFQTSSSKMNVYIQLQQSQFISANWDKFDFTAISDKIQFINYRFLGLNLAETPNWKFWQNGMTWAAFGLFLIPVVSAVLSWLQMKISQKTNPSSGSNDQAAAQMKSMNLMMPFMSLYIGFVMPGALGLYWTYGSLLAIVQEAILNAVYGKQIAAESAERDARMRQREAEYERRRQETERLKAEGKTTENENTSKKKQQARQRAELDEMRAAAIREEKAAKRAAMGLGEEEIPASQVGNRRYARGRAYVADRFTNPDAAEAATEAAAAESERWAEENRAEETPAPEEELSLDPETLTEHADEEAEDAGYDDSADEAEDAPDEDADEDEE